MKFLKIACVFTLIYALSISNVYAKKSINRTSLPSLYKTTVASTGNFDGNRVYTDLENNGMVVSHRISGHSGMEWPKNNSTYTVFVSGVWLAGLVNGDIRTAAAEYSSELVAGPYGGDKNSAVHKVYKVSKSDLADPLASDDFQNWPVEYGAPWVDVDEDGVYNPLPVGKDMPEFIGDQVVWYVANDGDVTAHNIFGSLPLGIETQTTIFGFNRPDVFGDMMFVKQLIINKGGSDIEDMYIGLWSDPDLGDAGDDFVACDTILGMGICYNDGVDGDFAGFSGGTPAVGYDFFQGPMVPSAGDTALMYGKKHPGFKNLKMSSFSKYINTSDPDWSDPEFAEEVYNLMQGLKKDGSPSINSETGEVSKFFYPDDPSDNTGVGDGIWADADDHASGDRRFLMNAGPFTMAAGDSQEVVFGIFMAAAGGPFESFAYLKEVDALAQLAYDIQFALPASPPQPVVEVATFGDEIILSWDAAAELYNQEDEIDKDEDGENTFFMFEGYNVYQVETVSGTGSRKLLATYDLNNGITEIFDDVFDPSFGEIINRRVRFGSDSGIQRFIKISTDGLNNGIPLKTNREYYYAVTAYGYNPYGIPKTLESSLEIIAVRPQVSNSWAITEDISFGEVFSFSHPSGPSDGFVEATIVDPMALTGDDYEITIAKQHYYRDVDGIWKFTNSPDAVTRILGKTLDCSGSTLTASALASSTVGTVDLVFTFAIDCGSNWVDGIVLDLPDGLTINSWEALGDCSYGLASGQNCVNLDGTLDATTNTITWGDDARTEFGAIEGGQVWVVNVQPPASYPLTVSWVVYDDAYDGTTVDAEGDAVVDELGYEFMTLQEWTVSDGDGNALIEHQTLEGGVSYDMIEDGIFHPYNREFGYNANPIANGLMFALAGPPNDMKTIGITANAAGPTDPVELGAPYWSDWLDYLPNDTYTYDDQQSESDAIWYIGISEAYGSGTYASWIANGFAYSGGLGSADQGIGSVVPDDIEIRFTGSAGLGKGIDQWETGDVWDIPFEVWNIGDPADETDDFQCIVWILDDDGSGDYGLLMPGADQSVSGGTNDPYTDRIYTYEPLDRTPGSVGHDAYIAAYEGGAALGDWYAISGEGTAMGVTPLFHRTVFWMHNGGETVGATDRSGYVTEVPETGTIWHLATTKPNTVNDVFTLEGGDYKGISLSYDESNIKAWPNPYFGYNPEERNPVDQQMHFTHLPETGDYDIRIFDLTGTHVKTITGSDVGTQFAVWDLRNDFGIPVASGMYIAHVTTSAGEKVLKLAVVQPEQRLDRY